eukprot:4264022-Pleurochrysis_carterae.AAC.1
MKYRNHPMLLELGLYCAHQAFAVEVRVASEMRSNAEQVDVVRFVVEDDANDVHFYGIPEQSVGSFGRPKKAGRGKRRSIASLIAKHYTC